MLHYISSHNLIPTNVGVKRVVSYSVPISNHNVSRAQRIFECVVSYSVPISNHNCSATGALFLMLYLILFLYQTTTYYFSYWEISCCILFCSYIKPQPTQHNLERYIVVSYSVPISNHNFRFVIKLIQRLYLILFLYQTTTYGGFKNTDDALYLILFLYQTTTQNKFAKEQFQLYLILFLYQTTTLMIFLNWSLCCILFCSYIKPQRSSGSLYVESGCILFCSYIKPQLGVFQ